MTTNPTKHHYAPELSALFNGKVIYVSDSKGNEYVASLSINNQSAIAKVRLVNSRGNIIEGLLSSILNDSRYTLHLKPKDE